MSLLHVCIVDDDAFAREIAINALDNRSYHLIECQSGEECLTAFAGPAASPDVVLLDIGLPGLDGLEVCRRIRAAGHEAAQIIFVSSHEDLESRLAALDAGGSAFVVKPYEVNSLRHQLAQADSQAGLRRALAGEDRHSLKGGGFSSRKLAVCGESDEVGTIVNFMREAFSCANTKELAESAVAALRVFGLHAVLHLRDGQCEQAFSSNGLCTELERSILNDVRKLSPEVQLCGRLVINHPWSTLLVLDLPPPPMDRSDRLHGYLNIIAETVEARLAALASEIERSLQSRAIFSAVELLTRTLDDIEERHGTAYNDTREREGVDHVRLLNTFLGMGFSERRSFLLGDQADETLQSIGELMASDKALAERIKQISATLSRFIAQ